MTQEHTSEHEVTERSRVDEAALSATTQRVDPGRKILRDAREMRALAHPVRIALLDALRREGTLTATEAAELLDETPANCSFHLRTLAKYGYVEEADGGTGRQRPWKRTAIGLSFSLDQSDPEATAAARELDRHFKQNREAAEETWGATWQTYPMEWQAASFRFNGTTFLTAGELEEVNRRIIEIIDGFQDRMDHPERRPEGARAVSFSASGFPLPTNPRGH